MHKFIVMPDETANICCLLVNQDEHQLLVYICLRFVQLALGPAPIAQLDSLPILVHPHPLYYVYSWRHRL